jgi:hypothetical protein
MSNQYNEPSKEDPISFNPMSNIYASNFRIIFLIIGFSPIISCNPPRESNSSVKKENNNQDVFWGSIQQLCGKSYKGAVVAAPANDTSFRGKELVMHVRSCAPDVILIPFHAGEDHSRTWVLTKTKERITLKHDHRHKDGTRDSITQYGGHTSNSGSTTSQFFPADQQTINIIPAAAGNVWWIEMVPGKYFTYNLRRLGTERFFSIRFDLSATVENPVAPWGW